MRHRPSKLSRTFAALAAVAGLVSACGSPQRPVEFATSTKPEAAIDAVCRALASAGHTPANVDRQADIVQTEWKDSAFMYGQIGGTTAIIVRRYTVTLSPGGAGSDVVVRIDAKRCPEGGYTIGGAEVRGSCEEVTAIPGRFQEELDAVGADVRRALGGTVTTAASAATAAR